MSAVDSEKWHREASEKLREVMDRDKGIKTSEGVHALINAMHLNFRDDSQSTKDMLNNAALMTGMATALLLDHAEVLADREADKLEEGA